MAYVHTKSKGKYQVIPSLKAKAKIFFKTS